MIFCVETCHGKTPETSCDIFLIKKGGASKETSCDIFLNKKGGASKVIHIYTKFQYACTFKFAHQSQDYRTHERSDFL